ncbi:MAG: CapA family protein [Chloroflexi bacterium]|nr:CapA family protein [Chloroflexota bacterium]
MNDRLQGKRLEGANRLKVLAVGDLILGMPDPESYFRYSQPILKSGDVVIGQGEVPYTRSTFRTRPTVISAPDPDNMRGLTFAGFNIITLAGNLIWNYGLPGIQDTVEWLHDHGISTTGAGMNIDEARRPILVERHGIRVGVLDYNCVGPREAWASPEKAGCAYISILTHYEPSFPTPGGPSTVFTLAEPRSLESALDDIRHLRPLCDVLIVALHKGITNTPVTLADYDRQVSHAAVDAGADLILGHHAHILKGIEVYRGKVIFHGLGNFVTVVPRMPRRPGEPLDTWALASRQLYHFEHDPEYPTFPFHPEARKTIIARCIVEDGRISQVGYVPCLINTSGQPEVLGHDARGQQVFDYVDRITREAGLNGEFEWEDNEVAIRLS